MGLKDSLEISTNESGATVYDMSNLLEDMCIYEAIRVACADLLDIPREKIPMDAEEYGEAMCKFLSDDMPDRFQNQYFGLEYMGKYCITIHSDGTMVVKDLPLEN